METSVDSNGIELVSMAAIEDEAEKRAHHNALERKRRDHIKDSFYCLRDAVPQLRGEKASRALILNKATDYIKSLKGKNMCHKKEIDDIKKQNDVLEQEIDKIIKLNNSLGKDRIELVGEEFVKVVDGNTTAGNPQSTPPTFTRITEKDKGPCIGKRELDFPDLEEGSEDVKPGDSKTTVMKITKPLIKTENVSDTKTDVKNPVRVNIGSVKPQTAKIAFAQAGSANKNGGTIQIPASALAKALPNGFKNVTAIYKQTGNNKPIRLQIITHNGATTGAKGAQLFSVKTNSPKKTAPDANKDKQDVQDKKDGNIVKDLKDIAISSEKKEKEAENKEPEEKKEEAKNQGEAAPAVTSTEKKPERRPMSDGPRTPQNQPLYARHRILHSSPSKEKKNLKDKPAENTGASEFDSYKTEPNFPGEGNAPTMTQNKMQALKRDPSAIATISESELAFLTRPTNNAGNLRNLFRRAHF